jgi:hypothetical protein
MVGAPASHSAHLLSSPENVNAVDGANGKEIKMLFLQKTAAERVKRSPLPTVSVSSPRGYNGVD